MSIALRSDINKSVTITRIINDIITLINNDSEYDTTDLNNIISSHVILNVSGLLDDYELINTIDGKITNDINNIVKQCNVNIYDVTEIISTMYMYIHNLYDQNLIYSDDLQLFYNNRNRICDIVIYILIKLSPPKNQTIYPTFSSNDTKQKKINDNMYTLMESYYKSRIRYIIANNGVINYEEQQFDDEKLLQLFELLNGTLPKRDNGKIDYNYIIDYIDAEKPSTDIIRDYKLAYAKNEYVKWMREHIPYMIIRLYNNRSIRTQKMLN